MTASIERSSVYKRGRRGRRGPDPIPVILVGEYDPMSALAYAVGINVCGALNPNDPHDFPMMCTRAVGHAEADGHQHPSALHVAADLGFVARQTWR